MHGTIDDLSIRELADRAGTTVRTVHYYVAEGLLPPAQGMKRNATYTQAHLDRLRLITALREEGLALAAIRARLAPLTDAQVRAVVATLDDHLARGDAGWTTLGLIEAALTRETTVPVDHASLSPSLTSLAQPGPVVPSPAGPWTYLQLDAPEEGSEHDLRESAGQYLDRLLRRRPSQPSQPPPPPAPAAPPPMRFPGPAPLLPPSKPDPYLNVRPEAWYHFRIDDGIELRVREDRYRESRGQLRSIVDALRPILQRYGLSPPEDSDSR